jgi:hypothetical protein
VCIAAATHAEADERRTAEYMLRHRIDVIADRRSALALLSSARCAAEMDVRRIFGRETPTPSDSLSTWAAERAKARLDDPSVGEAVVSYLHRATGHLPATHLAHQRLLDAVAIAVEMSERHTLNNGKVPSLIAMRPAVRAQSRLVTHLRTAFGDGVAARSLARLLVGGDGSPIESSLLWWAAHPNVSPSEIPSSLRRRWVRDLWDADPSIRASETHSRRARAPVPTRPLATLDLQLA